MKQIKSQSPLPSGKIKKIETLFSFPKAIEALIGGSKIRREEWTEKEEYCLLKDNFLMIHRNDKFHTWIVSEGDLLALDWQII